MNVSSQHIFHLILDGAFFSSESMSSSQASRLALHKPIATIPSPGRSSACQNHTVDVELCQIAMYKDWMTCPVTEGSSFD